MIRPPSNVREYSLVFSGDDALAAPGDDATDDDKKAWEHSLQVARQTGNWDGLIKPTHVATVFGVRPLTGDPLRSLLDDVATGSVGPFQGPGIAFRLALRSLHGGPKDLNVGFVDHPRYGRMADDRVTNWLDEVAKSAVNELGTAVLDRAGGRLPLS